MNLAFKKSTCRALVISVFALSLQTANAGLIGADQAAAPSQAGSERALVLGALDRADVATKLQAAGVDPLAARERVRAMSDQEVQQLAQDLQTAPAGADSGAWVAVLLIAVAVWYFAFRR